MKVQYIDRTNIDDFLHAHEEKVLAQIVYGAHSVSRQTGEYITIVMNVPPLPGSDHVEVWTSESLVSHQQDQSIAAALDGKTLVGSIQVPESSEVSLEKAVYHAYKHILEYTSRHGYPYLIRIWNYLPEINGYQDGLERYQRFCVGRHQAFSEVRHQFHADLPAASAVGTMTGPCFIYFIAHKTQGLHFENPRQISAYDYPPTYGPKSPSFARATFSHQEDPTLFLAGTASIVGHATQHQHHLYEQTIETLRNLDALVEHVQKELCDIEVDNFSCHVLKVYIRPNQQMKIVKEAIENNFGQLVPTLYLSADLCRKDLLVEVEGIYVKNEVPESRS